MNKIDIGFIEAATHSPEYLMHKYWARKPHNVISKCIEQLTPKGGVVLDPFCGSGVTLREGSLLGRSCYGFDLNPTAVLISSVLIDPPETDSFIEIFSSIFEKVYSNLGYLYLTSEGDKIRYLSHRIIVKCECGKVVHQTECIKEKSKMLCPHCGKQLRFNLENLADTEIFDITVEKKIAPLFNAKEMARQLELSKYDDTKISKAEYDYTFPENRRILAFKGIKTSNFFTSRNFNILAAFANEIWKISDEKIRNCCLLLLTGSLAQCSRLIAHRNNLSTGGPAWSVPGFWIPQEHLETNPFVHLDARFKKFIKALDYLHVKKSSGKAKVILGDSLVSLETEEYKNIKADLIFLDPPYGDSVPYTEFSNVWNSFLKMIPNSDEDISVSDRIEKNKSWMIYAEKLDLFMKVFSKHLTNDGKLLITFNNNDLKAWNALITALQNNHFVCKSVFYQIPAVISSKAQMSIETSYISDVYSVFQYNVNSRLSNDLSPLISHLCFIANTRDGEVSKIVLDREFIIAWLKNNIDSKLLDRKEEIIHSLFDYDSKHKTFLLKDQYKKQTPRIKEAVDLKMKELMKQGPLTLFDCYKKISALTTEFGVMEFNEFKNYIKDYAVNDGIVFGSTLFD